MMGGKWTHHLVLAGVVLAVTVESYSRAMQQHDDYPVQQQHQQHHHLRRQPQQQHHHHRQRNQTSVGYTLVSGTGGANGRADYRPNYQPNHHHHHQQQHHHHQQQWPHGQQHGIRETPPQHRRHTRTHVVSSPSQPPAVNGWRRTTNVGNASVARPVNRMLTRSGTSSYGNTRQSNATSRNVCTVYIYRKSLIKTYNNAPCTDPTNCTPGLRTYSAPVAKREVCCRGWDTTTTVADGCFKPVCQTPCRNGGRCTAPDRCACPAGYTGKYCELDVNECKEHKPCDQTCYNTEGSYYCTCRDGFMLQSDRQSCRRIDETNDLASEARDMENDLDVDYDSLDIRLKKIEQMMSARDDRQELNKKVQYTMDAVSVLKSQVARLTQRMFPSVDYGNRVH